MTEFQYIRQNMTNSIMTDFLADNSIQQFKVNLIMNVLWMTYDFPYVDLDDIFSKVIFKKSQRLSDL